MKTLPLLLGALCMVSAAVGQNSAYHTFTPPPFGEDITWPAQIRDTEQLYPGDEFAPGQYYEGWISIENEINNTLFFDDNYTSLAGAPNISDNALWGNPRSGFPLSDPDIYFDFDYFFYEDENEQLVEQVNSISFDFAWASSDPTADLGTLVLEVWDYQLNNSEFIYVDLDHSFSHSLGGNGQGYSGHVVITLGENVTIDNIRKLEFSNLAEVAPAGDVGMFAIDNLSVNSSGTVLSELSAVDYDGQPTGSYGTNSLKGQGKFGFTSNVYNGGSEPTTFSVYWSGSDPAIYQPYAYLGYPIDAGETVYGAVEWEIDTDTAPSGTYSGDFTITNDENQDDPDDTFSLTHYRLYDPPVLGGNAGSTLVVPGGNEATITNAPVLGHPGALRASVWITDIVRSDPRFTVSGMEVTNVVSYVVQNPATSVVGPGESLGGSISYNPVGAAAGTHFGTLRVKLGMTTPSAYLNRAQPVPDRVWTLSYTVPSKPAASPSLTTGQDLADSGADISGTGTGAALIGGTSSSDQTVNLAFNETPPVSNPSGYGSAINLDFGTSQELYVLQISYNDLPAGYAEQDLRIQALGASSWVPAISLNGNGGTPVSGAQPYAGSYAAYLAALGGGTLDAADLGAYGVDADANTAWIVLDYEGTFQLVTGVFTPEFKILAITRDGGTNTTTISYQSQPGVTHAVVGGQNLDSMAPVGTTEVGTGAVMNFMHQPEGAPSRFFYRMAKP